MLRTPTSDPAQDAPVAGATLVAEAPTAEEALAEVHAQLGVEARIVEARRVLRGGIGGFFAREVVQVHAAPGERRPAGAAASSSPAADGRGTWPAAEALGASPAEDGRASWPAADGRGSSPIDRLLADVDGTPDDLDFATFLREQLAGAGTELPVEEGRSEPPVARVVEPEAAPMTRMRWPAVTDHGDERPAWARFPAGTGPDVDAGAVAPDPAARSGTAPVDDQPAPADARRSPADEPPASDDGGPAWSVTALLRLGLPPELVRSLEVAAPADDVAWTSALAAALRPLCRPLPAGRSLVVGPRARGIAKALGIPVATAGQPLRARGDVAAVVGAGAAGNAWLEKAGKGRWLHLVVGGKGWRTLLHGDPLAVSWVDPDDLPETLRCAVELGLVLGYGPTGRGVGRARPLDVALAIRDLVPQR